MPVKVKLGGEGFVLLFYVGGGVGIGKGGGV